MLIKRNSKVKLRSAAAASLGWAQAARCNVRSAAGCRARKSSCCFGENSAECCTAQPAQLAATQRPSGARLLEDAFKSSCYLPHLYWVEMAVAVSHFISFRTPPNRIHNSSKPLRILNLAPQAAPAAPLSGFSTVAGRPYWRALAPRVQRAVSLLAWQQSRCQRTGAGAASTWHHGLSEEQVAAVTASQQHVRSGLSTYDTERIWPLEASRSNWSPVIRRVHLVTAHAFSSHGRLQ